MSLPLCLVYMQRLVLFLCPYKARIAELEVEVGTRNKLESKLESIQEVVVSMSHVECFTDSWFFATSSRRMANCIPNCSPRRQLLRACVRRGSFGGRSWLTKVCWGRWERERDGGREQVRKREGRERERKVCGDELAHQGVLLNCAGASLAQDRGRMESQIEALSREVKELKDKLKASVTVM